MASESQEGAPKHDRWLFRDTGQAHLEGRCRDTGQAMVVTARSFWFTSVLEPCPGGPRPAETRPANGLRSTHTNMQRDGCHFSFI